jgi:hypothetical protein
MEQYYKKAEIKSAILFIIENPFQDDFVMRNCRVTNQEGDDNSIELAGYWIDQKKIVDQHLIDLSLPLQEPITQPMPSNYSFVRDLTDEEWLKLPKEEILQLYKNCYKMLLDYTKVSNSSPFSYQELQPLPVVPSEITEEKILEKIQECVYYSDGDWSVKNSLRELAKEIYSLLKQSLPKQEETSNINWAWIRDNIRKLINKYKPTPYGELGLTNEIVEYLESIFRQSLPREDMSDEDYRKNGKAT